MPWPLARLPWYCRRPRTVEAPSVTQSTANLPVSPTTLTINGANFVAAATTSVANCAVGNGTGVTVTVTLNASGGVASVVSNTTSGSTTANYANSLATTLAITGGVTPNATYSNVAFIQSTATPQLAGSANHNFAANQTWNVIQSGFGYTSTTNLATDNTRIIGTTTANGFTAAMVGGTVTDTSTGSRIPTAGTTVVAVIPATHPAIVLSSPTATGGEGSTDTLAIATLGSTIAFSGATSGLAFGSIATTSVANCAVGNGLGVTVTVTLNGSGGVASVTSNTTGTAANYAASAACTLMITGGVTPNASYSNVAVIQTSSVTGGTHNVPANSTWTILQPGYGYSSTSNLATNNTNVIGTTTANGFTTAMVGATVTDTTTGTRIPTAGTTVLAVIPGVIPNNYPAIILSNPTAAGGEGAQTLLPLRWSQRRRSKSR